MTAMNVELDGDNQTARITLSGYTVYAHVMPQGDNFEVQLDDHLTGNKTTVTTATTLQGAVGLAVEALKEQASSDGVDTSGLDVSFGG